MDNNMATQGCPCGFSGDRRNRCNCTETDIKRYAGKISGPLIDRIDLHLEVAALDYSEMSSSQRGETSGEIKARVDQTRAIQEKRFADNPGIYCNGQMNAKLLEKFCSLDTASSQLLKKSVERLGLSARAYHRVLKIARTIADMNMAPAIATAHIAEAVQFCRHEI